MLTNLLRNHSKRFWTHIICMCPTTYQVQFAVLYTKYNAANFVMFSDAIKYLFLCIVLSCTDGNFNNIWLYSQGNHV